MAIEPGDVERASSILPRSTWEVTEDQAVATYPSTRSALRAVRLLAAAGIAAYSDEGL